MTKTRIGERLSAVAAGSSSTKGRSHELESFNERYAAFNKTFRPLTLKLKNHHANLKKVKESQGEVLEELAKWAKETPVEVNENNAVKVQKALLKKDETYSEMYVRNVIEYVHDWELCVKTRVEATQKQVKESKQSLDHYEQKVEKLAKAHEMVVAKGKTAEAKDVEKLKRNEEKLALAKNSHETQATRLCDMIEAVVDGAWKDLVPLFVRMTKMDRDMLDSKKMLLDSSNVIEHLQNLAEENKIDLTTPPPGAAEKTGSTASVAPAPKAEHIKHQ